MAEDPIKLFSTRAGRYPEANDSDLVRQVVEKCIEAVPGGSILTFVFSQFLPPLLDRRREDFLKDLADAIQRLEEKKLINPEDLVRSELFVTAVVQATRTAISNHQREKLEALRNAVINVALSCTADEEMQLMFLGLIETLSVTHLVLLNLFNNRGAFSHERRVQLMNRRTITDPMILDLNSRGLVRDPRPLISRSGDPQESLVVHEWSLTPLGKEFLTFITTPEQLK